MTKLTIKEHQDGDVTVLDMDGDIRIDGGNVVFRNTIHRLLGEGRKKVLLNLAGVAHIDSSGLGELISSRLTMNEKGGQIKLLHLTQRVRELMKITKLMTVLDVYESRSVALESFKGHAPELEEHLPVLVKVSSP
jgi:anti-sigma B factor antagonist